MANGVRDDAPLFPLQRESPLDPPSAYHALRERCPVSRVRLWDGEEAWLVTGYEALRSIMRDSRASSRRTLSGLPAAAPARRAASDTELSFIAMDGQEHRRLRLMLTPAFSLRRIELLRPQIEEIVEEAIEAMVVAGPPAELVAAVALEVPARTICRILGMDEAQRRLFQALDHERNTLTTSPERVAHTNEELLRLADELVAAKEARLGDDLVSELLREQVEPGHLNRDELVPMVRLLLSAGHETTASMIAAGALVLLHLAPRCFAELRDDEALVAGAVEELLRYLSVFHLSPNRVAVEEIEIAGVRIEPGEGIIASPAGPNRDPGAFEEPDRFDMRRPARHHLAFGFGPHQCLGQHLARLELGVVFRGLAERLPSLRLAAPFEELEFRDYNLINVAALPVAW